VKTNGEYGNLQVSITVQGLLHARMKSHITAVPYRCRCSKCATVGRLRAAGARRSAVTRWPWTTCSAPARTTSSWEVSTASSGCMAYAPHRHPICVTRLPTCWSKCRRTVPSCRCALESWSGQCSPTDVLANRSHRPYYDRGILYVYAYMYRARCSWRFTRRLNLPLTFLTRLFPISNLITNFRYCFRCFSHYFTFF